ncbi:hypothetical protein LCGC14_0659910 [marine sediment metagenome]|uniref:Uncharacterized protein n=1 Tax=marine sediment metagenome TaxID=412755 RepID=A0A0F9RDV9_9ZZZZ
MLDPKTIFNAGELSPRDESDVEARHIAYQRSQATGGSGVSESKQEVLEELLYNFRAMMAKHPDYYILPDCEYTEFLKYWRERHANAKSPIEGQEDGQS